MSQSTATGLLAWLRSFSLTRSRAYWLGSIVVVVITLLSLTSQPALLAPMRAKAEVWVPVATIAVLCLHVGCPIKHTQLPSMDSMAVAVMACLAVVGSVERILDAWVTEDSVVKESVVGATFLAVAGLKALDRAFKMADEMDAPGQRRPETDLNL